MSTDLFLGEYVPERFTRSTRTTTGPAGDVQFAVLLFYYSNLASLATWDHAQWDTAAATWNGAPSGTDVVCDVLTISTQRGRDEPLGRFNSGTCSVVVDDPDGNLSPWQAGLDQFNAIRPGIKLQITATYGGTTYGIYTGYVTSITDAFPTPTRHTVTFAAADALQFLSAYTGAARTPTVGDGDLAAARLLRLLSDIAFPDPYSFDPGTVPLQPTALGQNYLSEAGLVADTEIGALFMSSTGTLRFRDRNGLASDPLYNTVQFTFGEIEPELCYQDIVLVNDSAQVRNVISISNVGGTAVTHSNPDSIALNGIHTYSRDDLIHQDPAQSSTIADEYLLNYANANHRVDSLVLNPIVFPSTILAALSIGLNYLVHVNRRASGFQVSADLQIESIQHDISATDWTVTFGTFSAANVFTAGRWDVGTWGSATWGLAEPPPHHPIPVPL